MEYGVTDKGFVMKRFDTILKEVQEDLSGSLGFDVSQNPPITAQLCPDHSVLR